MQNHASEQTGVFERFSSCLQHLYISYTRTLPVHLSAGCKSSVWQKEWIFPARLARRHDTASPPHGMWVRTGEQSSWPWLHITPIRKETGKKKKIQIILFCPSLCHYIGRFFFPLHMALILLQQQQTSPEPPPGNLLDVAQHSRPLQRSETSLSSPLIPNNSHPPQPPLALEPSSSGGALQCISPTAPEPSAGSWQVLYAVTQMLSLLVVLAVVEAAWLFQGPFGGKITSFPLHLSGLCIFPGL